MTLTRVKDLSPSPVKVTVLLSPHLMAGLGLLPNQSARVTNPRTVICMSDTDNDTDNFMTIEEGSNHFIG